MKVLLSIKPEYTEKIFSGEKRYEFRKRKPKQIIERVFVYECNPSKNIIGWFNVKRILSGSPGDIWKKCKKLSGINKEKYFAYCNGKKVIYAFEIDETFQFDTPINPFEINSDFKAPQNFSYIDNSPTLNKIERFEPQSRGHSRWFQNFLSVLSIGKKMVSQGSR